MRHCLGECSTKRQYSSSVIVVLLASVGLATAAPVRIRVTDPAGAEGLGKVLIIVQALNGKGEVSRNLSDSNGWAPAMQLPPEVYRVIATFPYGYWFTQVREFVVADSPVEIVLHMDGAVVERVQVPELEARVTVIDKDGKPAENAIVLGRDPEAIFHYWTTADANGHATVKIGVNGADIVAIYKGRVVSKCVDVPFEDPGCRTDGESFQRRLEKSRQSLREVTLQFQ
ncbi:MAG: hypothetical protein ABSH46_00925 [Bryobacteraceae bacterium]|jgi:hypothetical protein